MRKIFSAMLIALSVIAIADFAVARGGGHGGRGSSHYSHSSSHSGYHSVHGYFRKNGTYVAPHFRTNPNGTRNDNWSTKGNVNPFTGKAGTKPLDLSPGAYR